MQIGKALQGPDPLLQSCDNALDRAHSIAPETSVNPFVNGTNSEVPEKLISLERMRVSRSHLASQLARNDRVDPAYQNPENAN